MNPHLYNRLQYDPQKDFRAVGLAATNQMVLLVSEKSGITTLDQFRSGRGGASWSRAPPAPAPRRISARSRPSPRRAGGGEVVPYRGEAPALNDLVAGTVDVMVSQSTAAIPLVRAGQARGLAVTGARRLPELPDLPTAAEAGLPGLDLEVWNALVAPRGVSGRGRRRPQRGAGDGLRRPAGAGALRAVRHDRPGGGRAHAGPLGGADRPRGAALGELLRAAGVQKEG